MLTLGTLFALILIGHLIGDYFVQTEYQATTKKFPCTEGHLACAIHCLTYSCTVVATIMILGKWLCDIDISFYQQLATFGLVYLSHYPFDRTNIIGKLMALKGLVKPPVLDMKNSTSPKDILDVTKYFVVYVVADNTAHLFFMTLFLGFLLL